MTPREIALKLQVADATVRALIRAAGFTERQHNFDTTQVERICKAHELRKRGYAYKDIPTLLEQEKTMSSMPDHQNNHARESEFSNDNFVAAVESPQDKVIQRIVQQAELNADVAASIYKAAFHRRFIEQVSQGDAIDAIEVGNGLSLDIRARELGYLPPASSQESLELESPSSIALTTAASPLGSVLVSYSASE